MKKVISVILATLSMFSMNLKYKITGQPKTVSLPSTYIADSKPKKYFTISLDDGITQDKKLIEIMKKYNFYACSFNINTGLLGANWKWVGENSGRPDVTHIRFTEAEIKSGIYDGYDVLVHTMNHPAMKDNDNKPYSVFKEVEKDAENIYKMTGIKPVGMAWPGGDGYYTDKSVENVYKYTSIRFARGTTSTKTFALPTKFLKWYPTCSFCDGDALDLAEKFLEAPCEENMLFYIWGHGYEFDINGNYDVFEKLVKMMSESDDVVCVTNTEFYLMFKDVIPSM